MTQEVHKITKINQTPNKMKSMKIRVSKDFEIQAENRQEGLRQIREKFENGEMTHEDLDFKVEAEEEDADES